MLYALNSLDVAMMKCEERSGWKYLFKEIDALDSFSLTKSLLKLDTLV